MTPDAPGEVRGYTVTLTDAEYDALKLRAETAEASLAELRARHEQYVEWAEPQIVQHGLDTLNLEQATARLAELSALKPQTMRQRIEELEAELAEIRGRPLNRYVHHQGMRIAELEAALRRIQSYCKGSIDDVQGAIVINNVCDDALARTEAK